VIIGRLAHAAQYHFSVDRIIHNKAAQGKLSHVKFITVEKPTGRAVA
jgi:hypothetical protein